MTDDEVKKEYLKWVVEIFTKKFDERYFGTIENMKFQNGMICHIEREMKSDPVRKFERK
jgi:hypothetical protein